MVAGMDPDDLAMAHALWRHGSRHELEDFLAQGNGCGWCRHPIRLRGFAVSRADGDRPVVFSSGSLPDGVVLKACGARSELQCPSCAAIYRGDSRHLVRAGLEGGKGVDESVAEHPAVFLTLTAPSFGAVHTVRGLAPCHAGRPGRCEHGRPIGCGLRHASSDPGVGTPLCPDCYDYPGAVLQNASTPELWRRTMIYAQRRLAVLLGCTQKQSIRTARLASCRVTEFQRRGLVHLHAVVRADGPNGTAPPIDGWQLAQACADAVRSVSVKHPGGTARWGHQLDVQVIELGGDRATRVATYVAKYATKASADHPVLEHRIVSEADLARRGAPPHLHRMAATAWALGDEPGLKRFGLRRHAHRLGYSGHFLTKSRNYSTTFGALREARVLWKESRRFGAAGPATVSRRARWRVVGSGWANKGEALFAGAQQRQRAEDRREEQLEWYSRSE
jgi:Replication initiator protein, pSAM2